MGKWGWSKEDIKDMTLFLEKEKKKGLIIKPKIKPKKKMRVFRRV